MEFPETAEYSKDKSLCKPELFHIWCISVQTQTFPRALVMGEGRSTERSSKRQRSHDKDRKHKKKHKSHKSKSHRQEPPDDIRIADDPYEDEWVEKNIDLDGQRVGSAVCPLLEILTTHK